MAGLARALKLDNGRSGGFGTAIALSSLLLLSACGGGAPAEHADAAGGPSGQPPAPVRLIDVPGGGLAMYPQILVAQELGLFRKNNVEVERTDAGTSGDAVQLLITGNADIATVTPDVAVQAVAKGAELVVLAATATESPYYINTRTALASPTEFAGKKLGVPQLTGTATFLAQVALAKAGLAPDRYNMIVTGKASQRLAALTRGAVDATVLPAPLNLNAESQGLHRLMYIGDAVQAPGAVLLARRSFVEKHRDVAVSFLKAFLQARAWIYDASNREAFLQAVPKYSEGKGVSAEALATTYDEFIVSRKINPVSGPVDLKPLATAMIEFKQIKTTPDVAAMVDNSLVEDAARAVATK